MSTMNPEAQSSLVAPQKAASALPMAGEAARVGRQPLRQRLLSLVNHSLVSIIVILIALVLVGTYSGPLH